MHFENISPNLQEDIYATESTTEMIQFADLDEDLDGADTVYSYPSGSVGFFPPPSPSMIFHAPRQTLPMSRMGFPGTSTHKDNSSPCSSTPITLSRASMVGDVHLSDIQNESLSEILLK